MQKRMVDIVWTQEPGSQIWILAPLTDFVCDLGQALSILGLFPHLQNGRKTPYVPLHHMAESELHKPLQIWTFLGLLQNRLSSLLVPKPVSGLPGDSMNEFSVCSSVILIFA
jgi:hypothetical protein